jgi:hypothetical protein
MGHSRRIPLKIYVAPFRFAPKAGPDAEGREQPIEVR